MAAFKAWWAKSRWAVWIVVGVLAAVMLLVLRSLFDKKIPGQPPGLPPVPKALQDKVDKAQEDNLVARIESKAKAEEQKKQLAEVMKVDDGAERRKRLAALLAKV